MALKNASISTDATAISATGGSADTLESISDDSSKHSLYYGTGGFLGRSVVEFSKSEPQANASTPSGYTQARCTLVLKTPKVLANSETTINTLRLTHATDVETTDAEKLEMVRIVAQMLGLSDFSNFWTNQSLS